jgi:hypothetical protein
VARGERATVEVASGGPAVVEQRATGGGGLGRPGDGGGGGGAGDRLGPGVTPVGAKAGQTGSGGDDRREADHRLAVALRAPAMTDDEGWAAVA